MKTAAVAPVSIRKAIIGDVGRIQALVNHYASKETMLGLSLSEIYDQIRDFTVAEGPRRTLIGVCALHVIWDDLAEIRSLAVDPKIRRRGVGRSLVERCLDEARGLQIPKVFALTYQAEFFRRSGFERVDKAELPHKVWRDCLKCTKFPNCDETAVLKIL
ncbi:MAG: N-acetyltransferase [Candidatus Methylomirabilia bacterium]